MSTLRVAFLAAAFAQACFPASLAVSAYFKDGFTPSAIAFDSQGNVLVAGTAVTDAVERTLGAAVAKLDPKASQLLYFTFLDSAASDTVSSLAVDSAGNAYVAGWTTNPNFSAAGGGSLGTPPSGVSVKGVLDQRSFVTKLNPDGVVLFSVLIGGSVPSQALGIAITQQGQILISGLANASSFPSTQGAYNVADSNGQWFLMELDPSASKVIFAATGIGGSSIALDGSSNIYVSGSSARTDYPTTPGAYQTKFVLGDVCFTPCFIGYAGVLQHITKVDPTGSTLIYSTGLNDTTGEAGNTANTGLAVDAAGNAFVTGTLLDAVYPFTVPAVSYNAGYLSKLDPTGASLLFSVPVGGGGVALDSSGSVYVGGIVPSNIYLMPVAPPAILSWVPRQCWPDGIAALSEAYVVKLDSSTGNALDAQWIDGSAPTVVGITLAGGNAWIAGATPAADIPLTPGALSLTNLGTGFTSGAYVAAVDFSKSLAPGTPVVACVLDAANLEHVRAVAPSQIVSLFGANLGPATGVAAPDGTDTFIAGVVVTEGGATPFPFGLLYVSSSQINVVAPVGAFQVIKNGVSSALRELPGAPSNLNLFANLSYRLACPGDTISFGPYPLALNADGSLNSCANPAKFGSTISFFVDGSGPQPLAAQLTGLQASAQQCSGPVSAPVERTSLINNFVYQVDVQFPAPVSACNGIISNVIFSYNGAPVGPLIVPSPSYSPIVVFTPGQSMSMIVFLTQ